MLSESDFAAKIKAKYPQYAKVPDAILVQKIIAKHPEYKDSVQASWTGKLATAAQSVSPEAASSSAALAQHVQDQKSAPPSDPFNPFPVQGASNLVQKAADSGIPAIAPLAQGAVASMNNLESGLDTAKQGVGEVGSAFTKPDLASGVTKGVEGVADVIGGGLSAAFAPLSAIIQKTPVVNTIFEKLGQGEDSLSGFLADKIGTNDEEKTALKKSFSNLLNLGLIKYGPAASEKVSTAAAPYISDMAETIKPHVDSAVGAVKSGVDAAKTGVSDLYSAIRNKSPEQVDAFITKKFEKGVRPSVAGKTTLGQLDQYKAKTIDAVKTIADNKANLELTNDVGELTGKLPENLNQFAQAIDQTKTQIFKQYDEMQKAAGGEGATVDLAPISDELLKVTESPVLQDAHPDVVKYAQDRADAYSSRGSYTPEQAQEAIKIYNESLKAFYKNPTYETASKAGIDAMIANNLRAGLDASVENISGPGYQELKNKYGALKTIEKDVIHRSVVDARKNVKGLLDFTDVFTAGELVKGLGSMLTGSFDPASVAAAGVSKLLASFYKHLNDPNVAIQKLFKGLDNQRLSSQSLKASSSQSMAQSEAQLTDTVSMKSNIDTTIQDSQGKSSFSGAGTATNAKLKAAALERVATNKGGLVDEYLSKNKKLISTDRARDLFTDLGYKRYNSAAVQDAAKQVSDAAFNQALASNPEPNGVLYAGGSGVGKTSTLNTLKQILGDVEATAAAVLDGNLTNYDTALKKLGAIVENGKTPKVVYIYRDIVDSFTDGVVKRMLNSQNPDEFGRVVPVKVHVDNHVSSLATIKKLYEEGYGENMILVNNDLGKGNAKLMTLDELDKIEYNKDVTQQLTDIVTTLFKDEKISKEQYQAFLD